MLVQTEGIVISYIKFRETSVIARIYTKELGLKSYIIHGVRSAKKNKLAFFQPLSLLDLIVYNKENAALHKLSEHKCLDPLLEIRSHPVKIFICLFIAEVLSKTIKEEHSNPDLFEFLKNSILLLNESYERFENFHLIFLLKLTKFLGFYPSDFTIILQQCIVHDLNGSEVEKLKIIITGNYDSMIDLSNQSRRKILELILDYFTRNIENCGEFRSSKILHEVLL